MLRTILCFILHYCELTKTFRNCQKLSFLKITSEGFFLLVCSNIGLDYFFILLYFIMYWTQGLDFFSYFKLPNVQMFFNAS